MLEIVVISHSLLPLALSMLFLLGSLIIPKDSRNHRAITCVFGIVGVILFFMFLRQVIISDGAFQGLDNLKNMRGMDQAVINSIAIYEQPNLPFWGRADKAVPTTVIDVRDEIFEIVDVWEKAEYARMIRVEGGRRVWVIFFFESGQSFAYEVKYSREDGKPFIVIQGDPRKDGISPIVYAEAPGLYGLLAKYLAKPGYK